MANHKSALKRNRQSQERRIRNRGRRSRMKNSIKEVRNAIEQNSVEKAQDALKTAIPVISKTAAKGTIHKKNAARKISRLTRKVNGLVKSVGEAA